MSGYTAAFARCKSFAGLDGMFEYVNSDGRLTRWNCGQAAAATLLTHFGRLSTLKNVNDAVIEIERRFPPDQLGGWLGSGRRRVKKICAAHDLSLREFRGETKLRHQLQSGNPVIVMLGVSGGRFWKWDLPGGH